MPAHSDTFPWPSSYGHYDFFEQRMAGHDKVASVIRGEGEGLYEILRSQGDSMRVFVCECYAFGIAQYMETLERLGRLDAVVVNSAWCNYSIEAKRHARKSQVGLYKVGEFMAALNRSKHWEHLSALEESR